MESTVKANIERIRSAIAGAALRAGRKVSDVRLMAVTKTVDDDRIMEAIEAGVDIIGESYVQEAKRKIEKMGQENRVAFDRLPPEQQGQVCSKAL